MSTVWEDTDGCAKQYRCALAIYVMTLLSSPYGIIMDRAINETGHGNNLVDELNATERRYLEGEIELIGKLVGNNTTHTGMCFSASKYVSVKFADQCLHVLNNK